MEQQPIHQNQQPIMMTPPEVVTVKDSLYLTDMLSWNLLAMKKAHFYAQQCQDANASSGYGPRSRPRCHMSGLSSRATTLSPTG